MKYTAYNYPMGIIVFLVIITMGVMEMLLSSFTIAAYLTLPLLPILLLLRNTYTIEKEHLKVSTLGTTSAKIRFADIQKIETDKTFVGQNLLRIYYSPHDFINVKLGNQQQQFLENLQAAVALSRTQQPL